MVGMDNYMNTYLDRRMKHLIDDWDLATENDISDFQARMQAIEEDTREIAEFEKGADAKLDQLEARLKKLREVKR